MRRTSVTGLAAAVVFTLACLGEGTVQGDRAANGGGCPAGETCDENVPVGLIFQGQVLYDEGTDRLGPILVGGQFDLSFLAPGGTIGDFDVVVDGDSLDVGALGEAEVELWGSAPGTSTVRVVNASTGALYDRLTLLTVALEDVTLTNVGDEARPFLYAGCDEMIGVRLIAGGGSLRAFDQNVTIEGPGEIEPDPLIWDCFRFAVPADVDRVSFRVTAGGEVWDRGFEVIPLDPGQACPETAD